jgi:hypothetical protein
MRQTLFTFVLLGLAFAAPASAMTITFSDTGATIFTPGTPQFTIPGFDATLGDLESEVFLYTASIESTGTVENGSGADGIVDGSVGALFTIKVPGPLGSVLMLNPPAPLGPQPIGTGEIITYSPGLSGNASDNYTLADPAELLLFIIGGDSTLSGTARSQLAPAANFTPIITDFAQPGSATLEASYNYTPTGIPQIPEPSTLVLLGAGGFLFTLARILRHL